MKVLLVTERYWPEVGAAPSRLANMAVGLKREGCDVDVLTSLPNYPKGRIFNGYRCKLFCKEQHEGITLFRYWIFATVSRSPLARIINMFSLAFTIWFFAFRIRRIRSYDTVIIQTPTLVVAASAMLLFKFIFKRSCVLNVSDIWPLTAVDLGAVKAGSISYRFLYSLERFLYRHADGVLGQSEEILNHVAQEKMAMQGLWRSSEQRDTDQVLHSKLWTKDASLFLYRNIQTSLSQQQGINRHKPLKLVFSGMLGVAQDVAGIVRNVPFRELGVELHILGGGKQFDEINDYCTTHPDCGVFLHGFVPKEQMADKLDGMDAGIVPLSTRIRGAFPSKVYDILPHGLPILYCGGGEAAEFINRNKVGLSCPPGDYDALVENIKTLRDMSDLDFLTLSERCVQLGRTELDFDLQMQECMKRLTFNL